MPLFHFECSVHSESKYRCIATNKIAALFKVGNCPTCNTKMEWKPQAPSSQVRETLDNGAMPKALDRLADAERLHHERSKKGDQE